METNVYSNDQLLVQRLNASDTSALSDIYNAYWQPLFLSSYNLLKSKELSEDIIQDVFLDLWNKRESLIINISLKAYLYACTRYKVYEYFRKNKNKLRVDLLDDLNKRLTESTPLTKLMHKELVQHIENVVATLPEKCRLVYTLSREQKLSHKEIAEQLNISPKTVENHITKALKTLKLSLGSFMSLEFIFWLYQQHH